MQQRGFVKSIILVIAVLIILTFIGVDVVGTLAGEEVRRTATEIGKIGKTLYGNYILPAWSNYIFKGLVYVWNELVIDIIVDNTKDIVRHFNDTASTTPPVVE